MKKILRIRFPVNTYEKMYPTGWRGNLAKKLLSYEPDPAGNERDVNKIILILCTCIKPLTEKFSQIGKDPFLSSGGLIARKLR
jgi:hypothetical protein